MRATRPKDETTLVMKLRPIDLPIPSGLVDMESLIEEFEPVLEKEIGGALSRIADEWSRLCNSTSHRIHLVELKPKKSNQRLGKAQSSSKKRSKTKVNGR